MTATTDHRGPELGVGGYSQRDGTVEFYQRVGVLLEPAMTVVQLGAGRGQHVEDTSPLRRDLHSLRGRVAHVVGLDVDDAVLGNPDVDEAAVIDPAGPFPLADASVDVVVSDWVFEHVAHPEHTAAEIARVLRPGGWLCARTPNKWGYVGLAARSAPNDAHVRLLQRLQPAKKDVDTFPVAYRLNTRRALRAHFPGFDDFTYTHTPDPSYVGSSRLGWQLVSTLDRLTPQALAPVLMVFLRKR